MNMAEAIANPLIVYVKRSARRHTTDVSQGPRPVLSRFAAARTTVACREFFGGILSGG